MDCYVADGYWNIGYTESDICVIVPAGSPGGGGTVAKAPDPIRPNRRAQVREALEDQLDKAQRVDEPVIEAPKPVKKPKRAAPIAPQGKAGTADILGVLDEISTRVQESIDAEYLRQAAEIALAVGLAAQDEADVEMLLLLM